MHAEPSIQIGTMPGGTSKGLATFGVDVLRCPRSGARLRLLALSEEATVVGAILRHLVCVGVITTAAERLQGSSMNRRNERRVA